MTCNQILQALDSGTLSAGKAKVSPQLQHHIDQCSVCQKRVAEAGLLNARLEQLPLPEAPTGMELAIAQRIDVLVAEKANQKQATSPVSSPKPTPFVHWVFAFVGVLLFALTELQFFNAGILIPWIESSETMSPAPGLFSDRLIFLLGMNGAGEELVSYGLSVTLCLAGLLGLTHRSIDPKPVTPELPSGKA